MLGVDVEVGVSQRLNRVSSGYVGTLYGLQGTTFKVRYLRSGQQFEFPIVLSSDYADWQALAAATLAPPLLGLAVSRCVVAPLARWQRRRRDAKLQAANAARIAEAREDARRQTQVGGFRKTAGNWPETAGWVVAMHPVATCRFTPAMLGTRRLSWRN